MSLHEHTQTRASVLKCGVSTPLSSAREGQSTSESRWAYLLVGITYRLPSDVTSVPPAQTKQLNEDFSDV